MIYLKSGAAKSWHAIHFTILCSYRFNCSAVTSAPLGGAQTSGLEAWSLGDPRVTRKDRGGPLLGFLPQHRRVGGRATSTLPARTPWRGAGQPATLPGGELPPPQRRGRGGAGVGPGEGRVHRPPAAAHLQAVVAPDGGEIIQGFGRAPLIQVQLLAQGLQRLPGRGDHRRPLSVGLVLEHPLGPCGRRNPAPGSFLPPGALPTSPRDKARENRPLSADPSVVCLRFSAQRVPFLLWSPQSRISRNVMRRWVSYPEETWRMALGGQQGTGLR
jgi:hypothetical protein